MQGATGRISQTVWDFTYCSNKKISFSLFVLIKMYGYLSVAVSFSVAGKYRIGTVCTLAEAPFFTN